MTLIFATRIEYVVDRLVDTVSAALDRSWHEGQQRSLNTPFLLPFVQNVLTKNRVSAATVLVALVYLDRSRKNLRVSAGFWACERALIGAMILANKVRIFVASPLRISLWLTSALTSGTLFPSLPQIVHKRRYPQHQGVGYFIKYFHRSRCRQGRTRVPPGSPIRSFGHRGAAHGPSTAPLDQST